MSATARLSAHIAASRVSCLMQSVPAFLKAWKVPGIALLGLAAAYVPSDAHGVGILSAL